ncbi:IS110 family transposase, partial [Burkholderia ubonensis]
MPEAVFIGIDVSRDTLEIGSSTASSTWQYANDSDGIEAMTAELAKLAPALVVLEATGGYEFEAACALQAAGLSVAVVNPRQARDFARAMGTLAKTDSLDARMLAAFARVLHQHPQRERFIKPLPDAQLQRLQALVLRRRQLVTMLTAER